MHCTIHYWGFQDAIHEIGGEKLQRAEELEEFAKTHQKSEQGGLYSWILFALLNRRDLWLGRSSVIL